MDLGMVRVSIFLSVENLGTTILLDIRLFVSGFRKFVVESYLWIPMIKDMERIIADIWM